MAAPTAAGSPGWAGYARGARCRGCRECRAVPGARRHPDRPGALTGQRRRRGAAGRARGAGPAPLQPTAAAARRIRRRDVRKPSPRARAVGAKVRRAERPSPAHSAAAPPPRPFLTAGPIPARPRAREIARYSQRDEPGASRLLRPGAHGTR